MKSSKSHYFASFQKIPRTLDETSHVTHVSLWKNDKPIPHKPQTWDPFCVDLF